MVLVLKAEICSAFTTRDRNHVRRPPFFKVVYKKPKTPYVAEKRLHNRPTNEK